MEHKYFIYGVPGVGKTTFASTFAKQHNYKYLELDYLRIKSQKTTIREKEPFIYEYSTEAWKKFGELSIDTAVEGFLAVRKAFQKYIALEIAQFNEDLIAEAVYIDPLVAKTLKSKVTLIITSDEKLHYSHFFLHRDNSNEEDMQFKAARYIQSFLIKEARDLNIEIIDNNHLNIKFLS